MKKFAVIGSGAWGTALAIILSGNGNDVTIWSREPEVVEDITKNGENSLFLPNAKFNAPVKVTMSLQEAIQGVDAVVMVVPAQFVRGVCRDMVGFYPEGLPMVICSKGIELESGSLLSEIVAKELPWAKIAVLSGPTFAIEAALGVPTSVTIACQDEEIGKELVKAFGNQTFRPYYSSDIIGAQVGGAVKNVLAIAAGIVEGKGMGDNTRAALITRGLAEIVRLAIALGADETTLMGMSGIGDLMLTANSKQSRNYSVGFALGQGQTLSEILEGKRSVAEGVFTAKAVTELAAQLGVEVPICAAMDKILNQNANVDEMIKALLSRPFKSERG